MTTVLDIILHYQRSIERSQDNEERLLHCISKLYKLPVKVEHLQDTGIGKTVNSLRKFNGEISVAAKALVTKWKAMVAAEEEVLANTGSNENDVASTGDERRSKDKDSYEHLPPQVEVKTYQNQENNKFANDGNQDKVDHRKDRIREKLGRNSATDKIPINEDSSGHRNSHASSSSKKDDKLHASEKRDRHSHHHRKEHDKDIDKSRSNLSLKDKEERKKHYDSKKSKNDHRSERDASGSHKRKREESSQENEHQKIKHSSSNDSHGSKYHEKDHKKESHRSLEKKSLKSSTTSTVMDVVAIEQGQNKHHNSKSTKSNMQHKSKSDKDDKINGDDGIDSSMGTNFSDVLDMLNAPKKKLKKSHHSIPLPPVASLPNKLERPSSSSSTKVAAINGIKKSSSVAAFATTSKSSADIKPDLLSSSAKLEPLDPSIVLDLPSISTNYKPLPLNPTVMDCVFNTSTSSSSRVPARTLTDAEALSHGISSKTMRTKIYSGIKTGQTFQVPKLFGLCIRYLQKNMEALEYTGGVPFAILKPVLERATPGQLFNFEEFNPYLLEDSDELWKQHVQRNYRSQKRQEMESWREMYLRCQEDQERKLNILAESIKQSQKIIAAPVRKTQLAYVDSLAKPPRNIQRRQEQFGTKSKLVATPAARVAALSSLTPNAVKVGDSRLRVAPDVRDHAQVSSSLIKPKKAPLMAKALQIMRGRKR